MKIARLARLWAGRHARLAISVAFLLALGFIASGLGAHTLGAVLVLLAFALIVSFFIFVVRPASLPRAAVVTIRLSGAIRERAPRSPLAQLRGWGRPTMSQLRQALGTAAADPRLSTLIVEIANLGVGLATAQELHDLLKQVRDAGKRVTAVLAGEALTAHGYLVACGADELVANPNLTVMMLGVAAGSVFVKNALDKLEIQAQTLQWKEYKGAVEVFSHERMSPELRESVEAVIADWKSVLAETVAESRRLAPGRARELVAAGFLSATDACREGLVDRIGYTQDIESELDPTGERKRFVSLARYLRRVAYLRGRGGPRPRLALIHGLGPVIAGRAPAGPGEVISGPGMAAEILKAARDDAIRALVLRVNSPGGSAVGSDLIWRAVAEARSQGKPVVVSMGDVAGSGGYYISMGADAIVAEPSTLTGSIGVAYAKFNLKGLLARIGIGLDIAKSDDVSDAMSPARAMSERELAQLDSVLGAVYENFIAKVAAERKLSGERAEELARGRIWSGLAARERGLVDELGGLDRAIAIARERAGIAPEEPHRLIVYPRATIWSTLRDSLVPGQLPPPIVGLARLLGIPERWAPALVHLLGSNGPLLLSRFWY